MLNSFVVGVAGLTLTSEETAFLRAARPAAMIVFARNVADPEQLRRLTSAARDAVGADIPVLIDQEGGRVQRLRPPHWRALPPASAYGALATADADDDGAGAITSARLAAHLTAQDLRAVGITWNCAPVLDLPVAGSHDVIGSRAYASTCARVIEFGRAVVAGHLDGGVVPIVKHMPGHGRATADSHLALPTVDTARDVLEATDFAVFRAFADAPAAMTAHVVFSAIDPAAPASTSARVHTDVLRGTIGFRGLLVSDDLSMKALGSDDYRSRTERVLAAGTDLVLHCNGVLAEMEAVAAGSRRLSGPARERYAAACGATRNARPADVAAGEAAIARAIAAVSVA